METSSVIDYCNNLKKIPQFSGTCWFNSILTIMLYSEGFRKCLAKNFNSVKKPRNDKLLTFLLFMLKNYNNIEKLEKVYKSFENFTLKTEYILLSYLKKYDEYTKKIFKDKIKINISNFGYNPIYITHILHNYNIPFINFIKNNNDIYINLKYNKTDKYNLNKINKKFDNKDHLIAHLENTDIIILSINNNKLYDFKDISDENNLNNYNDKIINCDTLIKNINNLEEEIKINNNIFKLDCCIIINNYSDIVTTATYYNYHAIAGINCNKKKYIINSQNNFEYDTDKFKLTVTNKFINEKLLLEYDWYNKLKQKYTFHIDKSNTNVITSRIPIGSNILGSLQALNPKILNYNIVSSPILFFYIKKELTDIETPIIDIEKNSSDDNINISTKKLVLSSRSISRNIKSLYNIELLTIPELLNIINTKIYRIPLNINIRENYKYLYYYLFKIPIDKEKSDNDLLKEVLIKIIKLYLSKYIIIKLYDDNYIFNMYVDFYNSKDITYLIDTLNKITYSDYNLDIFKKYEEWFYTILFTNELRYYDKYIIKLKKDNIYKILIRLLIDKVLFDKHIINISNITNNKRQKKNH